MGVRQIFSSEILGMVLECSFQLNKLQVLCVRACVRACVRDNPCPQAIWSLLQWIAILVKLSFCSLYCCNCGIKLHGKLIKIIVSNIKFQVTAPHPCHPRPTNLTRSNGLIRIVPPAVGPKHAIRSPLESLGLTSSGIKSHYFVFF